MNLKVNLADLSFFFFFLKRDAQRGDEWLPPRATAFLLFTERLQKNVLASPSPLPIDGFCFLISRIVKYEWTRSFPSFFFSLSPCCCHCERFPVFLFLNPSPSFSPNSSPLFITERIRRNKFFIGVNRGIFFFLSRIRKFASSVNARVRRRVVVVQDDTDEKVEEKKYWRARAGETL